MLLLNFSLSYCQNSILIDNLNLSAVKLLLFLCYLLLLFNEKLIISIAHWVGVLSFLVFTWGIVVSCLSYIIELGSRRILKLKLHLIALNELIFIQHLSWDILESNYFHIFFSDNIFQIRNSFKEFIIICSIILIIFLLDRHNLFLFD